jgi:hypothetical protein
MMSSEQKRWWNRRVPILRICAFSGAVAVLFGLLILVFYGENVIWDLRYHRTATFRGQSLQVPWFWREEVWTRYSEFELTRNHLLPNRLLPIFPISVTVSYENRSPADLQKVIDGMHALDAKLTHYPGDYFDPDASIDSHFVCTDRGSSRSEFEWINCFSLDGHWSVQMLGQKQDRSDFDTILRGVASMGTPSK